jgi:acetyl esterase/lipase
MEDVVIKSHTYRPMGTEIRTRDVSERSSRAQMGPVTFDIYYPPGMKGHERLPVVVEVIGFSDESELIKSLIGVPEGLYIKDHPYFTSLGRMLAASGVIAVCYRTTRWDDLWMLVDYLRNHSNALKIDPDNIGLWSISAQPVIASSYAFQPDREYIQYGVNSYGVTWAPDMDPDLVEDIRQFAHAVDFYFDELPEPTVWRTDMPMFVVRCGKDEITAPVVTNTTDYFVEHALMNDVPVEFVDYQEGIHGYDYLQYTNKSTEILKQALNFVLEQAF